MVTGNSPCHDRSVLHHIVLFSFKAAVAPTEREALLVAIRSLKAAVPNLRSLEVGEILRPAHAAGYTPVAIGTFDDQAGLAAYLAHPVHLRVGARLGAAAEQLLAVDLEG